MKREVEFVYDFKAFGQAIKKARRAAGYSRKKLGHELNLAPRYLVSIENEGQHPSLQVLYARFLRMEWTISCPLFRLS